MLMQVDGYDTILIRSEMNNDFVDGFFNEECTQNNASIKIFFISK